MIFNRGTNLRMLKRLIPYFRPARRDAIAGALLLALAAGAELLGPWPIKWLVDHVFDKQPLPSWMTATWNGAAEASLSTKLLAVCGTIVIIAIIHRLLTLLAHYLLIRAGTKLVLELRRQACNHIHGLSLAYHDKTKVGDSLYRMAYDTTAALSLMSGAFAPVATGVLILVGITAVMLRVDWVLTLVAMAAVPAFWLAIRGFGKAIEKRAKAYHGHESDMVAGVTESLSSIRVIQAFSQQEVVAHKFTTAARKSMKANLKLIFSQLAFSGAIGLIMALGTAAVVWVGASRVMSGQLSVGDVLVFLAYLAMLYAPMNSISQSTGVIQSVKTQLARVFEVLDRKADIADRPNAKAPAKVAGKIEFENVSFEYEPGQAVLREISLAVAPGQVVAVVGRTGSGKTTLTSLLTRFYDPTAGGIKLDGVDLRDLPVAWLRDHVSIVLQDAMLMSGTIRENIALGAQRGVTPTDAMIARAAQRAQAQSFIDETPGKYESMIGERGVNLSGGQKQRIAIARAFLKDSPILILDEPTSALDAQTESALVDAICDLSRGRTTFIIAHRLSTVRLADTIVVMDQGRIAEAGTHRELIARGGLYASLCAAQGRSEKEMTQSESLLASQG
jgi:ABC-type multidrug transport system fused ATPase/permease subunit